MRARVGDLRIRFGAVIIAASSVMSVGMTTSAAPADTSTGDPDSSTTEPVESTTEPTEATTQPTEATTTTSDPFGVPASGDSLQPGIRPGTTVQTRTPPPPPTTTTLPPPTTIPEWVLPANSGAGRRIVYSKTRQRLWAIDSDGTLLKTHLVSGKLKWCDPRVGEHRVYSRSRYTNSIQNPAVKWGYMVRFAKGCSGGNIGFHEIPKKYGVPLQSIWQLGTPLSAGCVRQATSDAIWIWNWAWVGTKVVVTP
jgi:lipoprotein-anchoring transpeptidase ErfK/SrfK